MSEKIKNESTKVNDYLVDRIRKVEKENEELRNYCFKLENKAQRYDALKSMICFEGSTVIVRDLDGAYIGILATKYSNHYDEYLDLFDLREKE